MATESGARQSETEQRAFVGSQASGRGSPHFPALLVRAVDEGNRQIRVLASSGSLDRHGERILATAFKESIPVFMSNPVVLACHQHRLSDGEPPVVGSVVRLWIDKEGLWAIIRFAETELGEKYWQLYRAGHMKAVSVGFIPQEWSDESGEDGSRVRTYSKVELLEISCVPVPSNRDALVRSTGKRESFVDRKREERRMLAEIKAEFPDDVCRDFAEALLCGAYDIEDDDGDHRDVEDFAAVVCEAGSETDQVVAGDLRDCADFASLVCGDATDSTNGERQRAASHPNRSIPFDW